MAACASRERRPDAKLSAPSLALIGAAKAIERCAVRPRRYGMQRMVQQVKTTVAQVRNASRSDRARRRGKAAKVKKRVLGRDTLRRCRLRDQALSLSLSLTPPSLPLIRKGSTHKGVRKSRGWLRNFPYHAANLMTCMHASKPRMQPPEPLPAAQDRQGAWSPFGVFTWWCLSRIPRAPALPGAMWLLLLAIHYHDVKTPM